MSRNFFIEESPNMMRLAQKIIQKRWLKYLMGNPVRPKGRHIYKERKKEVLKTADNQKRRNNPKLLTVMMVVICNKMVKGKVLTMEKKNQLSSQIFKYGEG